MLNPAQFGDYEVGQQVPIDVASDDIGQSQAVLLINAGGGAISTTTQGDWQANTDETTTSSITPISYNATHNIAMLAVAVTFGDRVVSYSAKTFNISAPVKPLWYYVTVDEQTQEATCQTSDALVGVQGHTYIGAIQALPAGGSRNVLAGGWPAPTTFFVSKD